MAALLAACLPSPSTAPVAPPEETGAVVRLDPAAATIRVGETVSVSVRVEDVSDLSGAEFHLAFDPAVVQVIDADPDLAGVQISNGGMLAADAVGQNEADNGAGTVDYGVAQVQRRGVHGSGAIAVVRFVGRAAGTSPVVFRGIQAAPDGVNLSDSAAAPIRRRLQAGAITVE